MKLRVEKEFDREPVEPLRWLAFYTVGELSATVALCFMDLRQYGNAVGAAREALSAVQSGPYRRNQLAAQVRLGRALSAAGELEEAVVVGNAALALLPEVHSTRIGDRLKQLRDELVDRVAPDATEFSRRYEAVAT